MQGPLDIREYFQLAADRGGFRREQYSEPNLPTNLGNVTIMPFFGDFRSQFILSTLLLPRYLTESRADRYFVLVSHPGLAGLFPYVDEYWSFNDPTVAADILEKAEGFDTTSERAVEYRRSLREHFRDIVTWDSLSCFYDKGLTRAFFEKFKKVQTYLPPLRSLRMDLNRLVGLATGYKVFVYPAKVIRGWQDRGNNYASCRTDKEFWRQLFNKMLDNAITPVVWQTANCHDLSPEFAGRCAFFNDTDILDVFAVMRGCHCVLDVHNGLNRYAALARVPYICVEERQKFTGMKEFELDDLCVLNKHYQYIFSFLTILENNQWQSLVDNILAKFTEMLPDVNRDEWPKSSAMTFDVPLDTVRRRKTKRIGARFIKIPKM